MRNVRRYFAPGQWYFVTSNTHDRRRILLQHVDLFWKSWQKVVDGIPEVSMPHWVILPDHFHAVIVCPDGNLGNVMGRFKKSFALSLAHCQQVTPQHTWQSRYWDHVIRNDADLENHVRYIHYNPIKHGLVTDTELYAYSSLGSVYGKQARPVEGFEGCGNFGES